MAPPPRINRALRVAIFTAALAVFLTPLSFAADSPGEALKHQFDAAKFSLAANDLSQAESRYKQTIALALRQLGSLSISEGQFESATHYLEEALKLEPDDFQLQLNAAIAWFRRGDEQKASQLMSTALASRPDDAQAHNVMGRIFLLQGDVPRAIEELKTAVNLNYDLETAYFLGIAYLKARKMPEADELFAKIQSNAEESAALHVLLGRAYTISNLPEPAIAEFRKAIKLDPKYPREHGFLGYAYLDHLGEQAYPQAREEFEKELKINPDQYYFQTLLGIATVALRDFPAAEIALKQAVRLRPDDAPPYLYLGETYTETNRLKDAVDALQRYLKLVHINQDDMREVSRAYYLLGQGLLRLGRTDEAKVALQHSREYREAKFKYDQENIFGDKQPSSDDGESHTSERVADLLAAGAREQKQSAESMVTEGLPQTGAPEPPAESKEAKQYRAFAAEILASSYNDLGVMRAKTSQFAEAADFFKQAYAWNPALPGLDRNWAFATYRAELYSDSIPPLQRELAAHPDDIFIRKILSLSYFVQENYAKTADVLRPLLSNPPDDPALLFAWGTALVRTRQSAIAAKMFERLLQQNSANPGVHYLLGQAYAQQQDYPNALRELKAAVQIDPKLLEARYYTGLVYLHQSDFDNAAQEFRAELALRPGDPVTAYHLAFALLSQGQTEEAAALLRGVVKTKPDYELAHFELGRALLQQGDVEGAISSLETAKKLQPDRDLTYFQLSQAYRRAGRAQDAAQALATYRKMIEESRQKKRQSLETETP
ncbi:MAG TPA: tetratricopeptide repeat protein [Candidatus Acidoferrum sp.]|nr:tetratricopeptide repeat protein [Candidatus Acidoferrum sp.]